MNDTSRPSRFAVHALVGLLFVLTGCSATLGQPSLTDGVHVRVVDVGAGLCCIVRIPGNAEDGDYYIVYDAGNYDDKGKTAIEAIRAFIPENETIDLLVLSHTDSDHIAAVPDIVNEYWIDRILRTGMDRAGSDPKTLVNARKAIAEARDEWGALDLSLSEVELPYGLTWVMGDALVTMVCGFGAPLEEWGLTSNSKKNNAVSIVLRIDYAGKSILFCGDTVGRKDNTGRDADCIATEKFILDLSRAIEIDSDVMIAPHHGADNASCTAFIEAVSPDWVIFSAGHKFKHPRQSTADRFIAAGVDPEQMLRTDRGDDEGSGEWDHERIPGQKDGKGDDDIEILISPGGALNVKYRNER